MDIITFHLFGVCCCEKLILVVALKWAWGLRIEIGNLRFYEESFGEDDEINELILLCGEYFSFVKEQ